LKLNKKILKAWNECNKLRAEGDKLWAEGSKLRAEGRLIFINAVIKEYGNIKLEWKDGDCHLENGEVYLSKEKQ
jgi:hypothetical protein